YGVAGGKYAPVVTGLVARFKPKSILDYGCGKGYLAKALDFPIWEYDPAVPGKDNPPRPAELVICSDVLEHIEPDKLDLALDDIKRCVIKLAFFAIYTGPAKKTYADGRNTHLSQHDSDWWLAKLKESFDVGIGGLQRRG